jgi:hypothetical protein
LTRLGDFRWITGDCARARGVYGGRARPRAARGGFCGREGDPGHMESIWEAYGFRMAPDPACVGRTRAVGRAPGAR